MAKFDLTRLFGRKKEARGMNITIMQDLRAESALGAGGATTASGAEIRSIPFIGSLPAKTQYWIAGGVLLASFATAVGLTVWANKERAYYGGHTASMVELKQRLVDLQANSYRVALGLDTFTPQAYLDQKAVTDTFSYMRSTIFDDQKELGGQARKELDLAWSEWSGLSDARSKLADTHVAALTVRSKFASAKAPVGEAFTAMRSVLAARDEGSPEARAQIIEALPLVAGLLSRLTAGEANVSYGSTAAELNGVLTQLPAILEKMNAETIRDPALRKSFDDGLKTLRLAVPSIQKLNASLVDMEDARAKAAQLSNGTNRVLQLADYADVTIHDRVAFFERLNWLVALFSALGLASMGALAWINNNEGKKRTFEAKNENEANQRAIMSLLDEIANLADGDLRVRATVTEEITGAIADSVNFAISEMSSLVTAIKNASSQISRAAGTALSTSKQLSEINAKQAQDITDTGRSVLGITEAIEQVSRRMGDSKQVAQSSVESSTRGMQAVHASIEGIKSIQDNVEETGKRIRRLTEQSLQISEIVELIGDISERTSVLAINATIQATKAGSAGKGFKVVADAVQELANQAAEATRRIGALINAIQTDIQGAGAAMQKTTEEASRGAALAEITGEVLAEINDVSQALSEIVVEINEQIGNSAKSASDVSQTMKSVLDSVAASSAATKSTGEAVEAINKLTESLGESVSGFQL
jgi:twitching motility protein PilJ